MKKYLLHVLFIFACFSTMSAQGGVTAKFGKGIRFEAPDTSLSLKFELRFQTLFELEHDLGATTDATQTEMMIRRARLKFSGFVFNPGWEYKVELGLSNRDIESRGRSSDYPNIILDAFFKKRLSKNFKLRVGQFKLPGNRERVISSGSLQLVDRSLVNSRFNIDRDMGVMLEGKHKLGNMEIRDYLAISKGEGRNRLGFDTGLAYSGRIEWLPMGAFGGKGDYVEGAIHREETPKLSVGVWGCFNDDAQRSGGQLGSTLATPQDITTIGADYMFKYKGISSMGEYANRMSTQPVDTLAGTYVYAGQGISVQFGYMLPSNLEFNARYTQIMPGADIESVTSGIQQPTIGVSKYWVGHNLKLQADVGYTHTDGTDWFGNAGEILFRVTTNLNF